MARSKRFVQEAGRSAAKVSPAPSETRSAAPAKPRASAPERVSVLGASASPPPQPTARPPAIIPADARHTGKKRRSARSPEDEIVHRLNAAARRHRWSWPFALVALIAGGVLWYFGDVAWAFIEWTLAIPILGALIARDVMRRRVVFLFDLDGESARWFAGLLAAWCGLLNTRKLWRVVDRGQLTSSRQRKKNAGATDLVARRTARVGVDGPRHLRTNVDVPTIEAGSAAVYFLPDQVLLREKRRYVGIDYHYVHAEAHEQRFVEKQGRVPKDAVQVGSTWRYANADGSRDKRFSDNPAVPVVAYGALELSIPPATRWRLLISRAEAAPVLAAIVNEGAIVDGR